MDTEGGGRPSSKAAGQSLGTILGTVLPLGFPESPAPAWGPQAGGEEQWALWVWAAGSRCGT